MAGDPGRLVGIDLGTTFSAIATLDDHGQPSTVANREGEKLTHSAVLLLEAGHVVVGQPAMDVALEQPEQVATLVKRRMGYPNYGRVVSGRDHRPETLSALILRKLLLDAEYQIGPIKKAVITVPAYFDDSRRKATKDAGRIAGLDVIDILDEPTAAALAYSFQTQRGGGSLVQSRGSQEQTVLVYDLGGGTFDVTVVRLTGRRFQCLGIEGDVRLGGKDWDERIVDHVATQFQKQYGTDPRANPQSVTNLGAASERAKRTLSKLPQTTITCSHEGRVMTVPLTRTEFETMTRDLLIRTKMTTQQVVRQAGLTWDQIDRVLLVGGSTHMPMTRQMLQELTGKAPDSSLAVSEVVACGAAIHAGILAAQQSTTPHDMHEAARAMLGQVVEINVNAHSLGIEVKSKQQARINSILIPKNTQLPTANSRVFYTVAPDQRTVRVKVLQGEATNADDCISVGECWIEDLPPNLPNHSPVQVRCSVGSNGLIDVLALDMTSGKMARTEIRRDAGLTDAEIDEERRWVGRLRIE